MRERFEGAFGTSAVAGLLVAALSSMAAGQAVQPRKPAQAASEPYTAEFKITQVQMLANGTTITRESTRMQAMDSQGRSITAITSTPQFGDHSPMTSYHVDDPVAVTQMDWDTQRKKVTIMKMPPVEERHGCWRSESGRYTFNYPPERPRDAVKPSPASGNGSSPGAISSSPIDQRKTVAEDLGTMTILGIEAHGQRTTTTTPAGAIGNDQPLVRTSEEWNAPGLHFALRRVVDDPQQGKEDSEPMNLIRGEPDPALFQPPEGYEVMTDPTAPCKE